MDAGIQGSYILDYLFEAVPGSGLINVVDTFGFTQKFRSQADVGLQWGGLRSRLTWNHLAGYFNTTVTPRQRISNFDTFDLPTTGGSVLTAVEALREAGAEVVGVAVVVDRDTGAREAIEAVGLPYRAALSAADLGLA